MRDREKRERIMIEMCCDYDVKKSENVFIVL